MGAWKYSLHIVLTSLGLIYEAWRFKGVSWGGSPRKMEVQEASVLLSWFLSWLENSVAILGCMYLCVSARSNSCRIIITPLSHRLQVFLWRLLKWLLQELLYGLSHRMSHYHPALFLLVRKKWQYKNMQDVRMGWFIVLIVSWLWALMTNLGTVL